MQYLLLIYRSEAEAGKMDAATRQQMMTDYGAFTQSIIQSGNFKAGDALQPATTATGSRGRRHDGVGGAQRAAVNMTTGSTRKVVR